MIILIFILLFATNAFAQTTWQHLAPGLDYTSLKPVHAAPWGSIHAFRINLKNYKLDLAFASDTQHQLSSVATLARKNQALIAVNGGFFTPKNQPIGLRIKQGKQLVRLKGTSWWGVFYIKNGKAHITAQQQYKPNRRISFAIQSGPRLLVNGQIPNLKAGLDERSALGITRKGKVIVLTTQNSPISTEQLAKIMRAPLKENGLNCLNAINLDGGHSTQMYARVAGLTVDNTSFAGIADAVLVKKK